MSLHSQFYKGSKIRLIKKDGSQIIAKFIASDEKKNIITDKGYFRKRELRSCNYFKPFQHEMKD